MNHPPSAHPPTPKLLLWVLHFSSNITLDCHSGMAMCHGEFGDVRNCLSWRKCQRETSEKKIVSQLFVKLQYFESRICKEYRMSVRNECDSNINSNEPDGNHVASKFLHLLHSFSLLRYLLRYIWFQNVVSIIWIFSFRFRPRLVLFSSSTERWPHTLGLMVECQTAFRGDIKFQCFVVYFGSFKAYFVH